MKEGCRRNSKGYRECRSKKDGGWMVHIPAGKFWRGSNSWNNTKPKQKVYLDGYWIDKYETTVVQFEKCVNAGSCKQKYYRTKSD